MTSPYTLLALCLSVVLVGCASAPQSKFTAATVEEIKTGMPKSEVLGVLGEPRSRSVDTDGNQVWQYRKNAKQGQGMKTFANITSFGMTSGIDAEYQDILTVVFKSDVVSKATYQENVHTFPTLTQP